MVKFANTCAWQNNRQTCHKPWPKITSRALDGLHNPRGGASQTRFSCSLSATVFGDFGLPSANWRKHILAQHYVTSYQSTNNLQTKKTRSLLSKQHPTYQLISNMSEESIVTRILTHMNKDHAHNLEDYLVVYGHVDELAAANSPTMETLSLDGFTVSFRDANTNNKTVIRIPFEPSLGAYTDVRARFVQLAQKAAKKRGFSEYVVNDVPYFEKTRNVVVTLMMAIITFFVAFPKQLATFLELFNASVSTQDTIKDYITPFLRILVAIHSIEAVLVLYPLIRKHRMGFINKLAALAWTMVQGIFFILAYKRAIERASNPKKKN